MCLTRAILQLSKLKNGEVRDETSTLKFIRVFPHVTASYQNANIKFHFQNSSCTQGALKKNGLVKLVVLGHVAYLKMFQVSQFSLQAGGEQRFFCKEGRETHK